MKTTGSCLLVVLIIFALGCKKEEYTTSTSALLKTSVDSVHFDTVFTTSGSVSQVFKIINDNKKGVRITSVRLFGNAVSAFKIIVDGRPGPQVMDVDVPAQDSIYVFITVMINPNTAPLPFIIRDSIEITYNGHQKWVQLDAYGRNAHYIYNKTISVSEIWQNDLPYVILGKLLVDSSATLTINRGCRIYVHADAPVLINGTLRVNGEQEDSARVVFSGDRLDNPYKDYPASYPGIMFTEKSRNNVMNYTTIKNAFQAIVSLEPSLGTKLTLNQVVIDNAFDAGIIGINTSIDATNLLISNCGKNLQLIQGGNYLFVHCTLVGYTNNFIQHRDPSLVATDYFGTVTKPLNAVFRNCIFWGDDNGLVPNEVLVARKLSSGSVVFDKVLWRVQSIPLNSTITGAIANQYPLFDSTNTSLPYRKYRLTNNSPAKDKGVSTGVNIDLEGFPRPVGLPDLGAFEKQ